MKGRVLLLGVLLICLATDARVNAGYPRRPNCRGASQFMLCTMDYTPLCGSNGQTYSNECIMCSKLRGKDVWITKAGECSKGDGGVIVSI